MSFGSLPFPPFTPFPSGHSGISGTAVPAAGLVLGDFPPSIPLPFVYLCYTSAISFRLYLIDRRASYCLLCNYPTLYIYTRGRQKLRFFADLLPFFRRLYKLVLIINRQPISYSAHQKSKFSPLSFNLSPVGEAVQSGLPKIC